jgi:hypothetical protein
MTDMFDPANRDGKEHIAHRGEYDAKAIAETDALSGTVIRDPGELRNLASRRFDVFWRKERADLVKLSRQDPDYWSVKIRRFDECDADLALRVFTGAFLQGYKAGIERQEKLGNVPRQSGATVEIVNARHSGSRHLYKIELRDVDHFSERIRFEVVVPESGDFELQEAEEADQL